MQKVYVIGAGSSGTKIGVAKSPHKRVEGIKTGNPTTITLAFQSDARLDARTVERVAHFLLSEKRIQGEWFNVSVSEAENAVRQAIEIVDAGDEKALRLGRAKTTAQRVREAEIMHKARGERQIKVWIRADYPEDAAAIRSLADSLLKKHSR